MLTTPLTDTEYQRLEEILSRSSGEHAMNLEEVDGFFAALICGPEAVLPSEYLPEISGGDTSDDPVWESKEEFEEFFQLLMRHWNSIAHTLLSGEVFLPYLLETDGIAHGNDWARGFMRGTELRKESWLELLDDEDHAGSLIPIFALFHEHDPDPKMRPYKEPMSVERREQLIVGVAAGVMNIYRYFEPHRRRPVEEARRSPSVRSGSKIGRNQPCPCGSGKKHKRCCGGATVQ